MVIAAVAAIVAIVTFNVWWFQSHADLTNNLWPGCLDG